MGHTDYMARYREEHREEKKAYLKRYYEEHKEELKAKRKESGLRVREETRIIKEAGKIEIPITYTHLRKIYLKAHPLLKMSWHRRNTKRPNDVLIAKAKTWYQRHKEQVRIKSAEKRTEYAQKAREWRYEVKVEVLTYYGNGKLACVKCGEARVPCLSIDHIDGGGCQHRKELYGTIGKSIYYWLIENGYPEGFQTLCMNCQFLKQSKASGWYQ